MDVNTTLAAGANRPVGPGLSTGILLTIPAEVIEKINLLAQAVIVADDYKTCNFNIALLKIHAIKVNIKDDDMPQILSRCGFKETELLFIKSRYNNADCILHDRYNYPHKMPLSRDEAEMLLQAAPENTWLLRWSTTQNTYVITQILSNGTFNHILLSEDYEPDDVLQGSLPEYDISDLLIDYEILELNYSYGRISKEQAENYLRDKPINSWIVRYSTNLNEFVLSIKVDDRQFTHFNITQNHKDYGFFTFDQLLQNVERLTGLNLK